MHVALNGTFALRLSVAARTRSTPPANFVLTDVTSSCAFDFFAPHNAIGNRFQRFVDIDATGSVWAPLNAYPTSRLRQAPGDHCAGSDPRSLPPSQR